MSIEEAGSCRECRGENRREDKSSAQCGAAVMAPNPHPLLTSTGLITAIFVITPIILVSLVDPEEAALTFGAPYVTVVLLITFVTVVYAVGAVIVSAGVRGRSTARGILVGVGGGLLLGVASCTASFARWLE